MTTHNTNSQQMRSLLEELEQISKTTQKDSIIDNAESRVVKAITMAGHVLDLVKTLAPNEYDTLEKKFFLSVKHRNTTKFTNAFNQIKRK